MRNSILISLTLVIFLTFAFVTACGESEDVIAVGSKEFTEQLVLGKLTVLLLEEHGYDVADNTGLGGTDVLRQAMTDGDVDIKWEYTGTALITHLGHDEVITDSDECYQVVKEQDLDENGIVWLDYADLNNTYTLMMREQAADNLGINSISDLASAINQGESPPESSEWIFASNHEYATREDGIEGVEATYGFEFDSIEIMDTGITYGALENGKVDVAMGFATDGRIAGFDLMTLEDDENFHPVYNGAPNVRQEVLDEHPELEDTLAELTEILDYEQMRNLNSHVDMDDRDPEEVAREFLEDQGLIGQ